jgi:hypothetical protein
MRVPSIVGAIGAMVLAAALGCGPKRETVSTESSYCSALYPQGDPVDTVTVALFEGVDPTHAPVWQNDAERLVFYHLYETLAAGWDVYCHTFKGRLKESRSRRRPRDGQSTVVVGDPYTYTLRSDARFWDGTPVTAQDVAECARVGIGTSIGIDSVVVLDDRRVRVYATRPAMLETSARAVVRRTRNGLWPIGSGPYEVDTNEDMSDGEIILTPVVEASGPVVRFVDERGIDPRDLIDQSAKPGPDIVVLRDREVVEYATSLGDFEKLRTTWSRAYLFISVGRVEAIDDRGALPPLTSALQNALVRGSVRNVYVEGLSEREWEQAADQCVFASMSIAPLPTRSRRIVYDLRDPTAGDLADRIVSIAASDTELANAVPGIANEGSNLVSIGLSPQELANSFRVGADFAYVIGIRYEIPDFCPAMRDLLEMAPWLAGDRLAERILPLAKTLSVPLARRPNLGFGFDVAGDDFGSLMIIRRNPAKP